MSNRKNRRLKKQNRKQKRILSRIRFLIMLCILFILIYMSYGIYKESRFRTINYNINESLIIADKPEIKKDENQEKIKIVPVSKKYLGFEVNSRLEIPKIKLKTNVLTNYTKEGLKVCASRYYGPNANEIGNYCIAGHNYKKENMFNHLIDLEIGDKIILTDNKNGAVEYKIYDIYKVKPQNVNPLSQETEGKREVTLITCVNYSKNRLVVKACEVT